MHIDDDISSQHISSESTFVYPTEVCYGLGCSATNPVAVKNIFAIKRRQEGKSLLVLMKDISMCLDFLAWNSTLQDLADRHWPGPFTMVAPLAQGISFPEGVADEQNMIAFRISNHEVPGQIIEQLNTPIICTSANIQKHTSPYDPRLLQQDFAENSVQPDCFIDTGLLPERTPATIVRVRADGNMTVVRQGDVVVSQK